MKRKKRLSLAIQSALLTPWVFVTPVLAQPPEEQQVLDEVHVTGTRIVKANLFSSSPITQLDSEELKFSGTTRVEDLLKNLPQVISENNSTNAFGGTGTATVQLRYLGNARTLVLVDGRRLPTGSPLSAGAADINQIPGALIDRIEVLTGGASATYGSDAIAGVINFLPVKEFEGVKLDYQFSQYVNDNDEDSFGMKALLEEQNFAVPSGVARDGDTSDLALMVGHNFDDGRGNVTAYVTYRDIEAIRGSDRIDSACTLRPLGGDPFEYFCSGSSASASGQFTDFGLLQVFQGVPGFDFTVQGDQFVDRDGAEFNFAPFTFFQRPDERWTAGVLGHYEINAHVEAYTQLTFMDDRSASQGAPSAAFWQTDSLSCGNPLLSEQQFDVLCGAYGLGPEDDQLVFIGRRNIEGGPRRFEKEHTAYRGVVGLRGDINEAWRYDMTIQYAEVSMEQFNSSTVFTSRIVRALDVIADPATGEAVCRSVLDGSDPACVPWNIFSEGADTQAARDYFATPVTARGTTDQTVVSAYVAGNLNAYAIRSPFAESAVDVVIGAEYREENLEHDPDEIWRSGDTIGAGEHLILNGGIDVTEIYTEFSIPLVEGAPMAESLVLDLGYRYSDYSTGETTNTYKVAAAWSPVDDLRFRASLQHAVRIPNIDEFFSPQNEGFGFLADGDPCAGMAPARSFDDCARTGVTAAQYGAIPISPSGNLQVLTGGNPELRSEASDTRSIGVQYFPRFVDGLSISVDWFEIEIEDAIDVIDIDTIMSRCLDTGNSLFCNKIHRDPNFGDLWIPSGQGIIEAINQNIGFFTVRGYDLELDYSVDLDSWGAASFHNILSYLDDWQIQTIPGDEPVECAGLMDGVCVGIPEIRNQLRLSWATPWQFTVSGLWRHIGRIDIQENRGEEDLKAENYFDLSVLWEITETAQLRAGINNIFDNDPPILVGGPSGNTNGGYYDALGRYWFTGLSISF